MLRTGHDPRVYRTAYASYSDYDAEDHRLERNVVAEESEKRRRPEQCDRSIIQIECSPIIADLGWHQLEPHVLTRAETLWLLACHQAALDPAAETLPQSYESLCLISGQAAYADIEVEIVQT